MSELSSSNWSETAASNNAASPDGFPEGQAPSTVNDCAREMMSAIKKFWNRIQGKYASTGSANAYVLTPTVALAAYVTGERYSFRANFSNTGACTLNISGLGAKSIKKMSASGKADPASGDIQSGAPVTVEYDGTDLVLCTPIAGVVSSGRTITSGAGLTGGGDLSADRTLAVGAGTGIVANADDVAVDKATQAQMEAQTADKVATADNLKWHPGIAKAVLNLTTLTTTPTITTVHNALSTLTPSRSATGAYSLQWTNVLSNPHVQLTGRRSGGTSVFCDVVGTPSTTQVDFKAWNDGGTAVDPEEIYLTIWGDLA